MTFPDNTTRFSDRVEFYHKYRPGYPAELIAFLAGELGLAPPAVVADVGAGTGILSELLLDAGYTVHAVEPNDAMRGAAEKRLAGRGGFNAIAAAAEATTLPNGSVDLISAAQAFHWFNHELTKPEFQRILRPGGWLLLIWNTWDKSKTFFQEYEDMLVQYCPDYKRTSRDNVHDEHMRQFYGPAGFQKRQFRYCQQFDFDGLRGRLLSSSYTPLPGHPNHEPLLTRLAELFALYEHDGLLEFPYLTNVYYGHFS